MSKRYYNLERETKEYLKACEAKDIVNNTNIKTLNDYVINKKANNLDVSYLKDSPIVLNDLVLWLDAGVSSSYPGVGNVWKDLSIYDKHFTWNSVDWNSSGYFNTNLKRATGPASNSFGINNTTGYTIFFVFQTLVSAANAAFKFRGSVGSNRGIFCHPGWTVDTIYFDQGGCCNSNQRITYYNNNISNTDNIWNIVGLRSTVDTRSILYNNSLVTNTTTVAANINLDSNPVLINPADEGFNWIARLACFAVYKRGLTNEEYFQNFNAIKRRFSL
jgi:hypothetical protein